MDLKLFIFVVEVLGGTFHVCETKEFFVKHADGVPEEGLEEGLSSNS